MITARGDEPVAHPVAMSHTRSPELGFISHRVPDSCSDELPEDELAAWE